MHPAEIQSALKVRGYSQAALAEESGVKPAAVSMVINGRGRSAQIEARIAAITGHTLEELWPQWHGQVPLVLSDDERALILLCRDVPPSARNKVLLAVRDMVSDLVGNAPGLSAPRSNASASSESIVIATRGSAAAGRDQTIGVPPRRKK